MFVDENSLKPAEQVAPTTIEAEAPKVETKTEAETGEPAEGDEVPETADEAVEGQEPGESQKHSSVERRIRRLSAKLAAAAEENQALRELAFSKRDQAQAPAQAPAPAGRPRAEDFENIADFTDALTDWKLEQRAAQSQQNQAQATFNAKVEAFKASAPDYVEAVSEILPLVNDQIRDFVLESDVGPEVLYRLANNEAELERFSKMSAVRKLAYVSGLENQVIQAKTQRRAAPPAPPTRVTATPAAKADDVASSYAEWKARREAARKK